MNITLGADELILWLRKNGKACNVPNDGRNGLGRKIYEIIVNKCGGKKIQDDKEAFWPIDDNCSNIGKYGLPKTAAQYKVSLDQIRQIYVELNNLITK